MKNSPKIYLDHSATTPVAPEVIEAMLPYFGKIYGNAASIHSFGQEAKVALEGARRSIAATLGADPGEIVFTAGGTEGNNWAVKGVAAMSDGKKNHIVTSTAEHQAVLYPCRYLEKQGFVVTYLPVDETGRVSVRDVVQALRRETCLVSLMHSNNEVGTINPIEEIAAITKERGVVLHTDAVQSFGKLPLNVRTLGVDLLTLSGHKIYGPKGIGALYVRQGLRLEKLLHGGKHERNRRAGTENVSAAVGLGKAAQVARERLEHDLRHLTTLKGELKKSMEKTIPGVQFNGCPEKSHPAILNVAFEGVASDSLLLSLDLKGIAVSNGSACASGTVEPSHVLRAMGVPTALAGSALRFSFGRGNTLAEIERTVASLSEIVERLRKLRRRA